MAGTTFRSGQNTYNTGVSGGTQVTNNLRFDIEKWANALEPRRTPLLNRIGFGPATNRRPHYWGQSYLTPVASTVGSSFSSTTLTVATGEGAYFQKYMVLAVTDYVSGTSGPLDETTREIVWVSAEPSTDTMTVVRAQGGTTQATHAVGAYIEIIGTAEPELQAHTIAPVTRGVRAYNYVQRFEGGVKADKAAQIGLTFEHGETENPMMTDFKNEQNKQKFFLEKAVWGGARQAGDVATPLAAMLGGIETYITTNVVDLLGVPMTPRLIQTELILLATNTDGGPDGIELWMHPDTAAIFDAILDPIRMAGANDTSVSVYVETIKFRYGAFKLNTAYTCPRNRVYGLRPGQMQVRPYTGLAWHVSKKSGEMHGVDYDEIYTSGDYTFELMQEHSMFILKNFDQDLDTYGQIPLQAGT